MNLETKITIYKFTPQVFTLTPFFGMRKLLPTEITAQVIPVLPLEQFPVDPEQRSQQPAAHRQLINIILLKKDANSCVIRLPPATSFQSRLT